MSRIDDAAEFYKAMEQSNCSHPRCVRHYCDGLHHHGMDGTSWTEDCRKPEWATPWDSVEITETDLGGTCIEFLP